MKKRKIDGAWFLWGPIILSILIYLISLIGPITLPKVKIKEILIILLIFYSMYMFVSIGPILSEYKDNWTFKNYRIKKREEYFFRRFNILFWLIWIIGNISNWFSKHLTVKL